MFLLSVGVFYLPVDSGEKMTLFRVSIDNRLIYTLYRFSLPSKGWLIVNPTLSYFDFTWSNCFLVLGSANYARDLNLGPSYRQVSPIYHVNGCHVGYFICGRFKRSLSLNFYSRVACLDEEVFYHESGAAYRCPTTECIKYSAPYRQLKKKGPR